MEWIKPCGSKNACRRVIVLCHQTATLHAETFVVCKFYGIHSYSSYSKNLICENLLVSKIWSCVSRHINTCLSTCYLCCEDNDDNLHSFYIASKIATILGHSCIRVVIWKYLMLLWRLWIMSVKLRLTQLMSHCAEGHYQWWSCHSCD